MDDCGSAGGPALFDMRFPPRTIPAQSRVGLGRRPSEVLDFLVRLGGVEPPTLGLEERETRTPSTLIGLFSHRLREGERSMTVDDGG